MMNQTQQENPTRIAIDAVSPDELMSDFRGKPFVRILVVTIIAHILFIGVFSFGYMKRQLLGEEVKTAADDTTALSEPERMKIAKKEGENALRQIADKHGLTYTALSSSFANINTKVIGTDASPTDIQNPTTADNNKPAAPDSNYQKDLEQKLQPPANPDLTGGIEDENPIFPE